MLQLQVVFAQQQKLGIPVVLRQGVCKCVMLVSGFEGVVCVPSSQYRQIDCSSQTGKANAPL